MISGTDRHSSLAVPADPALTKNATS